MPTSVQIDEKWVDILPPEVPLHSVEPLTIMVSASLLVVLLVLGIFFYNRPRQRAKRALRRLVHDLRRSQVDIKPACFKIRQCLGEGFRQGRLQSVQLSHNHDVEWQIYLNRLTHCCFAAEPPTVAELESVIHEALDWLNKKTVDT
jgi:hypothetical protein